MTLTTEWLAATRSYSGWLMCNQCADRYAQDVIPSAAERRMSAAQSRNLGRVPSIKDSSTAPQPRSGSAVASLGMTPVRSQQRIQTTHEPSGFGVLRNLKGVPSRCLAFSQIEDTTI